MPTNNFENIFDIFYGRIFSTLETSHNLFLAKISKQCQVFFHMTQLLCVYHILNYDSCLLKFILIPTAVYEVINIQNFSYGAKLEYTFTVSFLGGRLCGNILTV